MTSSASNPASPQLPFIPENAPFTPAQRAWLNGFLAGIFSGRPTAGASTAAKTRVKVLFGSESGNSEALARRVAKAAAQRGFESKAVSLEKISAKDLAEETYALIITSTFGDGDPPENAKRFYAELHASSQGHLENLRYAVLALGDKNYEQFCKCGRDIDQRLEALGAKRIYERVDCDVDYDAEFQRWETGVVGVLNALANTAATTGVSHSVAAQFPHDAPEAASAAAASVAPRGAMTETLPKVVTYSRINLFSARLLANRKLTTEGSAKDTRHFEISLAGSGMDYEVGDALGVMPANCPVLVDDLLRVLNRDGEEAVPAPDGSEVSLRTALLRHYEITKIPALLIKAIAERSSDRVLADLMKSDAKDALTRYLWGREIIDLLTDFTSVSFTPAEFVSHLRKLQPRLYSISSSLKAHPEQVHLTIAAVRYESFGRARKGVCSTFLADRANGNVPVFVQVSHSFRLPQDGDAPVIMVGPGTGVAPFRAFLHERRAVAATGRNWLFFGEQRVATDFFYREEFEAMLAEGHLTRLSTAFSRDQVERIYVQNRMIENGAEVWSWLEDGAHFYVCGDAGRMAKDVDAALHKVVETHGGLSRESTTDYVQKLKTEKRYQRDVY